MDRTAKPFKHHDFILAGLGIACAAAAIYAVLLALGF